jgi:hypothetical protein
LFEERAHSTTVEAPITLRSWCPHSGAFGAIEHAELEHGEVSSSRHYPAQSVDFSNNSALCYAPDRWVAGHLADCLERTGDETNRCAQTRRCNRRFGTGVAGTDNDHIEFSFQVTRGHS